jgi:hypothetical protein
MTEDKNLMMDVEYGIDSRYKSYLESVSEASALMEARLRRMKLLSNDQITKAKLLQLKLKMEEFINHPVYDNHNHFLNFLTFYIDSIYSKRSIFAKDINVGPVSLSQVLNNHREPKQEFILKLMIHSERVYKDVCSFDNKIWYQIYINNKICEIMAKQEQWQTEIEKQVRISQLTKV